MSTDTHDLDVTARTEGIEPSSSLPGEIGFNAAADAARRALAFYNYQKASQEAQAQDAQGFSIIGGIVTVISLVTATMSLVDAMRNRTPAVAQVRLRITLRNLTLFPLVLREMSGSDSRLGSTPIVPSGESIELSHRIDWFNTTTRPMISFRVGDPLVSNPFDSIQVWFADFGGNTFMRANQVDFRIHNASWTTRTDPILGNRSHENTNTIFYRSHTMTGPASYTVISNTTTNRNLDTIELTVLGSVD